MRIIDIDTATRENPMGIRLSKDLFVYHGTWHDEIGHTFRLDILCVYFVRNGTHTFMMNSREYSVSAGELLLCHPNDFFSELIFSDDFYCTCIYCALDYVSKGIDPIRFQQCLRALRTDPILHLSLHHLALMTAYVSLLEKRTEADRSKEYNMASEHICRALISDVFNIFFPDNPDTSQYDMQTRPVRIYQDFVDMLAGSHRKERNMKFYADMLSVTPKYLSFVCKKISGRTAPEIITEYVMNDARRFIVGTDYSIKEIGQQLGFSNFAFFCRSVKKYFGKTPLELRNSSLHDYIE